MMIAVPPTILIDSVGIEGSIETLTALKAIVFGGAPMPQDIGDMLASEGANLVPCYGG
jgi:hypothetical protein